MSSRAPTIGAVVVRVRDLQMMTAFWSSALDDVLRTPPDDDWVSLRPRQGDGVALSFDLKPSEYGLPPRFHLDLFADDQAAEVQRLQGLGARVIPLDHGRVVDGVLMEHPEGNRFDVVQR